MNREEFIKALKELNIKYTEDMLSNLEIYCDYLLEYNSHTNLTAIKTKEEVYLKHFYDSLTISRVINLDNIDSLLDIGSGAGFPGVVLKIFYPHLKVVLIDSNNKKTKFLNSLVDKLKLINIEIVNDRIENFVINNLNKFDLVTARAVSNLQVLVELALPAVAINKYFIAMKAKVNEELNNSYYAIEAMGGLINQIDSFYLLNEDNERTLINIEKKRKTKMKELRSYDKIIKKPLQKTVK